MTAGPQHRQQQQPMTAGPQHRQQQQPMTAGPQHQCARADPWTPPPRCPVPPLQCRSVDAASAVPSAAARAESPEPQRAALVPPVPPLQRRPSWEPQRRSPRHLSTASAAASVPFRGHRLRAAQCRRFSADPWTPPPRCPVPPLQCRSVDTASALPSAAASAPP
ncbi:protein PYRICULARIA ORYZAE RESISTANCE 21-like [Drosophila serrata]|uniref:protein PYRICULARIA ORYZAE RESISTANCE 21-like n=1 Tax=Drosophila serrata TaxID=7274 RepID=UPI000A1D1D7E|nr:protein PYRICULARIA ORYZAE RESISTANCE 21-like [Drosophila serrata]